MGESKYKEAYDAFMAKKENRDVEEIALAALHERYSCAEYLSKRLKDDKEFLLKAVRTREEPLYGRAVEGLILKYVSDRMKDDKEFVLECVAVDGDAIAYASDRLKDDEDVARTAIITEGVALRGISARLRGDADFLRSILPYVNSHQIEARCLDVKLLDDEAFAMAFLSVAGWNLSEFSERIRDNKEIVLVALKEAGHEFGSVSTRLKADKEVVLTALRTWSYVVSDMDKSLFDDDEFVECILKRGAGRRFEKFPERIRDDRRLSLIACINDSSAYHYISDRLKEDEEFFREVLFATKDANIINWSSDKIKSNKELVMTCLDMGLDPYFITDYIKDDRDLVLKAVSIEGTRLEQASEELRKDILVALTALNGFFPYTLFWWAQEWDGYVSFNIFDYIPWELKADYRFITIITEAFLQTPPGQEYSLDDFSENPLKIYEVLDELGKEVYNDPDCPKYGFNLEEAIEMIKKEG